MNINISLKNSTNNFNNHIFLNGQIEDISWQKKQPHCRYAVTACTIYYVGILKQPANVYRHRNQIACLTSE